MSEQIQGFVTIVLYINLLYYIPVIKNNVWPSMQYIFPFVLLRRTVTLLTKSPTHSLNIFPHCHTSQLNFV